MLSEISGLANLIERVSQPTGQDRSAEASFLVGQFLSKSSDQMATLVAKSLSEALPPTLGDDLRLRLELLAAYWAYALVELGMPELDPQQVRTRYIRRSFRLRNRLEAQLRSQELYGHVYLLMVLDDRFWALSQMAPMVRELAQGPNSEHYQDPVLVESALVAGTFKCGLRKRLIAQYLRQLSPAAQTQFRRRAAAALEIGFEHPWTPTLAEADMKLGLDMLVNEGLAQSGPLQLAKLLGRVVSRELIELRQQVGFIVGLTQNPHFVRSAKEARLDWC